MADGANSDAYWQKGQQDMAALIDRSVKDQDKAQQVKSIVGEIVTELKAGREQERAYHRQLYTLNASYQATPEEFTKILDEANNQRMRTSAKILSLRFKMKELMTADEWKALSDQMLSYSSRYQPGAAGTKSGY
jgi:seryl-tRNA synthetase